MKRVFKDMSMNVNIVQKFFFLVEKQNMNKFTIIIELVKYFYSLDLNVQR